MNKTLKAILKPGNKMIIEPLLGRLYPYINPYIPKIYWDWRQRDFYRNFGLSAQNQDDYPIHRTYLAKYQPHRLLDIGCGYGRLFSLYAELNIPEVIGIDISPYAIAKAKSWPNYSVQVMRAEDLNFPHGYFDAAISSYTLSYVAPGARIKQAVVNIAEQCKTVLLIEATRGKVDYSRCLHDYESLFKGKMRLVQRFRRSLQLEVMIFTR